jgi:hypothetical protein
MTIKKEHAFYLHTCLQWMKWAIIPVSLVLEVTTWTKWNWQQLVYTTNHTYVTASALKLSCLMLHEDNNNLKDCQWRWRYCPLLKWMQLPCTAWYSPLILLMTIWGKHIYILSKTGVSLHDLLSTGFHLFGVSFIISLKSSLCTVLITQNTTEYVCVFLYAQNVAAVQLSVFLTGISWLMVTKQRTVGFPSAKMNWQLHSHCHLPNYIMLHPRRQ